MPTEIRTDAEPSEVRARASGLRYRPHLDGLRTVAVYLVIAFHSGLGLADGGFIGVDIFFVLSGFLVTQILVRDLASVGRIRGRQFYARRARRILPAAALALTGTAIAYSIVASPAEMLDALGGFRASFLYYANWFFIRQDTNYFAANINSSPVLHFWSLAVEEQFYLLWPLLLGGLFLLSARVGRLRWWVLRIVVVAAAAASAIAALHLATTNLSRAYYGTDTRAYQLLAGAALALTPQLLRLGSRWWPVARWTSSVALGGLLVLATTSFDWGPVTRGVAVAGLAFVLLLALENANGGVTKRTLSSRPFTYLGRISYGVYLWHWPVIVIGAHDRSLSPITLFVLSCVGATTLAALSFHLVEQPIRASRSLDRFKVPIIAIGLTTSIVLGVVVMPAILDTGSGTSSALRGNGSSSGLRLLDWRVAKHDISKPPLCLKRPVEQCTVVEGTGLRVVLMGDSHAQMWIPTFTEIAKQRSWSLSVLASPTCPWQEHLQVLFPTIAECKAHQADWYGRVIPKLDPDLIILVHQPLDNPTRGLPFVGPDGRLTQPDTPQIEPLLQKVSSESLRALERRGRRIVIVDPIPDAPRGTNPLSCLSRGTAPEKCAYHATGISTPLEQFYRTEARRPDVVAVDLDRIVCPRLPTCDAIIGDIIVKSDQTHLTATFARSVASQVGARIPK